MLPRRRAREPDVVVAVGGCYAEAQRDLIFERYPFIDVAFGPGSIPRLGEWIEAGGHAVPRGHSERTRPSPGRCRCISERQVQRVGSGLDGLQLRNAPIASFPRSADASKAGSQGEIVAELEALARGVRKGGNAARSERQFLGS